MTDLMTPRLGLPLLALAQAQKELTHNEALALIDILLHPVVEGVAGDPDLLSPDPGQCWLIAAEPTGLWENHANCIGCWTEAGWRYVSPQPGMQLFDRTAQLLRRYRDDGWAEPPLPIAPTGGTIVDAEARDSIQGLIAAMRHAGLIGQGAD